MARKPSYAGWWTEVMNYQAPQTLPEPTEQPFQDHAFQGQPSVLPTASEIKNGYSNTLPIAAAMVAASARMENTLPTAVSQESASFTTGAWSSLSQPSSSAEPTLYHGFSIPVKPMPPGAEDCCMSGCAHCIYDVYEEDRQEYKQKLTRVLGEIEKAGLPPPPSVAADKAAGDIIGLEEEKDADMDPGMKAFLELERKLKGS
ncbi:oxidoreductase-like protein [Gamsiella multidivaricata]|uniref:oxidoreductase-like protein n=1 Tax=Gamsiella multidivaricata TaxID=101098 RepID=UPI00222066B9|nr:oxidoreductase-like protein [Gamsiella multidivaricata]KAG0369546.1 hypothetical protein BGZ54_009607 [Gamsiella multidivaricata]KAI7816570.1 oxidoreductase-like protein [Gamsiella multidivaricata]